MPNAAVLAIEPPFGAGNPSRQAFERNLDTLTEFVVHGTFFGAPICRTAQHWRVLLKKRDHLLVRPGATELALCADQEPAGSRR